MSPAALPPIPAVLHSTRCFLPTKRQKPTETQKPPTSTPTPHQLQIPHDQTHTARGRPSAPVPQPPPGDNPTGVRGAHGAVPEGSARFPC